MKKLFFALLCLFLSTQANASEYKVDPTKSSITFSGIHAGNVFSGKFELWSAIIFFDEKHLDKSRIEVSISTASTKTGNKLYDGTLPSDDWFDAKHFPQAKFISTNISANQHGGYSAKGNLTIRGKTLPISFEFSLSDISSPQVHAESEFDLNRLSFDIGRNSDAKAEWVNKEIKIKLNLIAMKL